MSEWFGINQTGILVPGYPIKGTTFDDLMKLQLKDIRSTGTPTKPK